MGPSPERNLTMSLRALALSPIDAATLNFNFTQLSGNQDGIPYRQHGFENLPDFLQSMPDVLKVTLKNVDGTGRKLSLFDYDVISVPFCSDDQKWHEILSTAIDGNLSNSRENRNGYRQLPPASHTFKGTTIGLKNKENFVKSDTVVNLPKVRSYDDSNTKTRRPMDKNEVKRFNHWKSSMLDEKFEMWRMRHLAKLSYDRDTLLNLAPEHCRQLAMRSREHAIECINRKCELTAEQLDRLAVLECENARRVAEADKKFSKRASQLDPSHMSKEVTIPQILWDQIYAVVRLFPEGLTISQLGVEYSRMHKNSIGKKETYQKCHVRSLEGLLTNLPDLEVVKMPDCEIGFRLRPSDAQYPRPSVSEKQTKCSHIRKARKDETDEDDADDFESLAVEPYPTSSHVARPFVPTPIVKTEASDASKKKFADDLFEILKQYGWSGEKVSKLREKIEATNPDLADCLRHMDLVNLLGQFKDMFELSTCKTGNFYARVISPENFGAEKSLSNVSSPKKNAAGSPVRSTGAARNQHTPAPDLAVTSAAASVSSTATQKTSVFLITPNSQSAHNSNLAKETFSTKETHVDKKPTTHTQTCRPSSFGLDLIYLALNDAGDVKLPFDFLPDVYKALTSNLLPDGQTLVEQMARCPEKFVINYQDSLVSARRFKTIGEPLNIDRSILPENCCMEPRVKKLILEFGENMQVKIGSVSSCKAFTTTLSTLLPEYNKLQKEIDDFYTNQPEGDLYAVPKQCLVIGLVCIAKIDGSWLRVEIYDIFATGHCIVSCIDDGSIKSVDAGSLRLVKKEFIECGTPALSVGMSLWNIEPTDGCDWHPDVTLYLKKLAKAAVVAICVEEISPISNIPGVRLLVKPNFSDASFIDVADYFVAQKLAVYKKSVQSKRGDPHAVSALEPQTVQQICAQFAKFALASPPLPVDDDRADVTASSTCSGTVPTADGSADAVTVLEPSKSSTAYKTKIDDPSTSSFSHDVRESAVFEYFTESADSTVPEPFRNVEKTVKPPNFAPIENDVTTTLAGNANLKLTRFSDVETSAVESASLNSLAATSSNAIPTHDVPSSEPENVVVIDGYIDTATASHVLSDFVPSVHAPTFYANVPSEASISQSPFSGQNSVLFTGPPCVSLSAPPQFEFALPAYAHSDNFQPDFRQSAPFPPVDFNRLPFIFNTGGANSNPQNYNYSNNQGNSSPDAAFNLPAQSTVVVNIFYPPMPQPFMPGPPHPTWGYPAGGGPWMRQPSIYGNYGAGPGVGPFPPGLPRIARPQWRPY